MSVDYVFASSSTSHLLPTTPPPTLQYDQVSIVDGSASEQETILESPSDHVVQTLLSRRLADKGLGIRYGLYPGPASSSRLPKRQTSFELGDQTGITQHPPPVLSPDLVRPLKRARMDMNMAQPGSIAASAGYHTPLATYVAQMVVWLWYGDIRPPAPNTTGSPLSEHVENFDITQHPTSPLNPLQVQPTVEFNRYVARMLQMTMVSHSVTLIALLYIYRLKMSHRFSPRPGSEQRPFLAGLMLSNKYLDDNTYTNATWSELSGVPLHEVNQMEREFIDGLKYELGVQSSVYQHWSNLLDGFMLSRQQGMAPSRHTRPLSTGRPFQLQLALQQSQPFVFSTANENPMYRARSASPPRFVAPNAASPYVLPPVADHVRKHSAVDPYALGFPDPTSFYDSLQLPQPTQASYIPPTQHLQPNLATVQARPAATRENSASTLGRSTSLNRQYGRFNAEAGSSNLEAYGRRGSTSQVYGLPGGITPGGPSAQEYSATPVDWDGGRALLAPYERPDQQPQYIPPEHLMFYKLTAAPHPGLDGLPRKGRLRFQDPACPFPYQVQNIYHPQYPTEQPVQHTYNNDEAVMGEESNTPADVYQSFGSATGTADGVVRNGNSYVELTPTATAPPSEYATNQWSPQYVNPQPGQFANAGPPGFAYNPYAHASTGAGFGGGELTCQYPTTNLHIATTPAGPSGSAIPMTVTAPNSVSMTYDQFAPASSSPNRWSTVSDDHLFIDPNFGIGASGVAMGATGPARSGASLLSPDEVAWQQSRSEWSSPLMPRYD